jgi:hypothetical protein
MTDIEESCGLSLDPSWDDILGDDSELLARLERMAIELQAWNDY